jgi:ribosome-binding factor A
MTRKNFTKNDLSQRQLQVGEMIRHALSTIIRNEVFWEEKELDGSSVTITEVKMSPDLRYAYAFIAPMGQAKNKAIFVALGRVTPMLRSHLAKKITIKFIPQLRFQHDYSFDEARRMNDLMNSSQFAADIELLN